MLVGLTGVGGGSLMTPILVLLFNFHPATAVGTDLLYASITKTVGTAVHGTQGTVDWKIVTRPRLRKRAGRVADLVRDEPGGTRAASRRHAEPAPGRALLLTALGILSARILSWAGHHLHALTTEGFAIARSFSD